MSATASAGWRRDHVDGLAAGLMIGLCMLWGVQQVAIKAAVSAGCPPLLQGGVRSTGAAILVFGWVLRGGRPALHQLVPERGFLAPAVLLAALFGFEFVLIYIGLRFTTASRGVLFLYTTPLFVAVGAHLVIPGERLTPRRLLGLFVAFGGICVAVADGLSRPAGSNTLLGDVMVTAGAIIWAATTLLIRRTPVLSQAPPARLLLVQLAGSVPILFGMSWLLGEPVGPALLAPVVLVSLAYQIAIVASASYLVWFWLVAHYPAGRISAFSFLTPIFGMAAGAMLLGELISPLLAAALVCVIFGLWLQNRRG